MLLDVTALADEVVLGLLAGKAALALGAELGTDALGSAGNLALRNHGGGNWWARPVSIRGGVWCVCGVREACRSSKPQIWMMQHQDPLLAELPPLAVVLCALLLV